MRMLVNIRSQDFALTVPLRKYIERRLHQSMTYAEGHIQRIAVRLYDVNGPRGGIDKGCRVQVVLKKLGVIVISELESDLYVAIDRATDRAAWVVTRRLSRRRTLPISTVRDRPQSSSTEAPTLNYQLGMYS